MKEIEKLDKKAFIQHDWEKRLIWQKINEIIDAFNKSRTPQTPEKEI